jgi:hypothetical protein
LRLTAPEPLAGRHQIGEFVSGVASLDEWLKRRARGNQVSGASRTFVVCEELKVVGYYALASGAVNVGAAPSRFRRNMPDSTPVVILGRLAVHGAYPSAYAASSCTQSPRKRSPFMSRLALNRRHWSR